MAIPDITGWPSFEANMTSYLASEETRGHK